MLLFLLCAQHRIGNAGNTMSLDDTVAVDKAYGRRTRNVLYRCRTCGCGGMVDTLDSKSSAERRKGSSPFIRTYVGMVKQVDTHD